jgi:hypothetical protein
LYTVQSGCQPKQPPYKGGETLEDRASSGVSEIKKSLLRRMYDQTLFSTHDGSAHECFL